MQEKCPANCLRSRRGGIGADLAATDAPEEYSAALSMCISLGVSHQREDKMNAETRFRGGLRLVDEHTPPRDEPDHRAELQAAIVALRRVTQNPLLCRGEQQLADSNADLLETVLDLTDEVA